MGKWPQLRMRRTDRKDERPAQRDQRSPASLSLNPPGGDELRKVQELADNSPQVKKLGAVQQMADATISTTVPSGESPENSVNNKAEIEKIASIRNKARELWNPYDLSVVRVNSVSELPATGKNLVVIALVNSELYVRICNNAGQNVDNKTATALEQNERLEAFKKEVEAQLATLKPSELPKDVKLKLISTATVFAGHAFSESKTSPEKVMHYMSIMSLAWLKNICANLFESYPHRENLPDFVLVALGSPTRLGMSADSSDIDLCIVSSATDNTAITELRKLKVFFVLALLRVARKEGGMLADFEGGDSGIGTPQQLIDQRRGRDFQVLAIHDLSGKMSDGEQREKHTLNKAFDESSPRISLIGEAIKSLDSDAIWRMVGKHQIDVKKLLRVTSMTAAHLTQAHPDSDFSDNSLRPLTTHDRFTWLTKQEDKIGKALRRTNSNGDRLVDRLQRYHTTVLGWRLETDFKNPPKEGYAHQADPPLRNNMRVGEAQADLVKSMAADIGLLKIVLKEALASEKEAKEKEIRQKEARQKKPDKKPDEKVTREKRNQRSTVGRV